jgi:hypothetical protein
VKKAIELFMWGYQPHFAHSLGYQAKKVFAELSIDLEPDVLLVGLLKPSLKDKHPVCIEPEEKKWPLDIFSNLPTRFREIEATHPLRNMFYGDAPSMADKPEKMRRSSASMAVREALGPFDQSNNVRSFCGSARPVGDYYVVPVLQIANAVFQKFPPLSLPDSGRDFTPKGEQSLIHSAVHVLLDEASENLLLPDPGRNLSFEMRAASDIAREAAERFLRIPDFLTGTFGYSATDLFQRLNILSSLFYEGHEGLGSLILAKPDSAFLEYAVRFRTPVPLNEPRWARKILQMASERFALICSDGKIHGVGNIADTHPPEQLDAFTVNFLDHYQWELRFGTQVLMYSRFREPKLPQASIERAHFISNYLRLFKSASAADAIYMWTLFEACMSLEHGTMLVVLEDAETEADRLKDQGTPVEPVLMTLDLLHRVSGIDGSILLDPAANCFAIGVILDGTATEDCSPARGSRYNSALRYVGVLPVARMAIVVSEDKTVDLVPFLRPPISKQELDARIQSFEKASIEDYHADQNWLHERRFYIRELEARRINEVLDRLSKVPREVGEIRYLVARFEPSLEVDDSYYS